MSDLRAIPFTFLAGAMLLLGACNSGGGSGEAGGAGPSYIFDPTISCSPGNGEMLDLAPGSMVMVTGSVANASELEAITVNNTLVPLAADGSFEYSHTTVFGTNIVTIEAQDNHNNTSRHNCSFLVADQWSADSEMLANVATVGLSQVFVDDADRADLDSVSDLLDAVLNSQAFQQDVDALLANYFNATTGGSLVVIDSGALLTVVATYKGLASSGPHDVSMSIIQDGLNATTGLRDITANICVKAVSFSVVVADQCATMTVAEILADATFSTVLGSNGFPEIPVVTVNSMSVSSYTDTFGGLLDIVSTAIRPAIQNLIGGTIEEVLTGYINNDFRVLIEEQLQSAEVQNWIAANVTDWTFTVPMLNQVDVLELDPAGNFSRMEIRPGMAVFGIGGSLSLVSAVPDASLVTLGAAVPPGGTAFDPEPADPFTIAISVGAANKTLHTLWQGGYFDTVLSGEVLGGTVPVDAVVSVRANLPPVLSCDDLNSCQLVFGAMTLDIDYPGLELQPLLDVSAVVDQSISIEGNNTITFTGVDPQISIASGLGAYDGAVPAEIEMTVQSLVLYMNEYLTMANTLAPGLEFVIPAGFEAYLGTLPGSRIGIVNASIGTTSTHIFLTGGAAVY